MIVDEANRCKNIVANLLNFARQGKLKISKVNLTKQIIDIIKSINVNPQFEEISITLNQSEDDLEIDTDPDQIKQVFLNIITNACEAVEELEIKNVTINLRSEENRVAVEISDTGCGIPQENLDKLFTPFFTTKKMGKGTGLGLAISYGIIKMHKGDIKVSSNAGSGSTFKVRLPIKLDENKIILN